MSDTAANDQNGATPAEPPVLLVNAQYIRDLSFENPRAPDSLLGQNAPPDLTVEADVKARQLNEELFEIVLSLKVEARQGTEVGFLTELDYGAVITVRNAPSELMAALVLIEAPRLMFPFARAIVADAIRDGGFPALLIPPIDFADLQRRKAAAATATTEAVGHA
jgi:preprotein translocase subunit SecB